MLDTNLIAIASFFAQTGLLGTLSFNQLLILAANTETVTCPKGEVIFRRGEAGDTLYLLRAGVVKILLPMAKGTEATIALMNPGDVFGELSLLDGKPRSATAVAAEPVEALTLQREPFLAFLRKEPEAAITILRVLATRLRRTDELLGQPLFLDIPVRLAKKLLELAEAEGFNTDSGTDIALPVTQQDLARFIDTTPSTLSRYLRILRDRGTLLYNKSRVVILQPAALKELAE